MATEKGIILSLLGRNNSALAINIPHESLSFLIDADFDIIKDIFTNLSFLNFQSPRRLSSSHIVGTLITNCYNSSHVCGRIFHFGFLSDITSQCMTSYHIRIFLFVCSRLYDGIRCFESCGNGENAYPMNSPQFQEEKVTSVERIQSLLEYFRDELLQYRIRQSSDLSNNSHSSDRFLSNILNAWHDAAALFQVPAEESATFATRILGLQPPSKPSSGKMSTEESVRVDARLLTDIRTSLRKAIEASESDLALKIPSTALWNILILAETFGTNHITQCCLSILHYHLCPTSCDLGSDVRSQLPFPASDSLPPDTIADIITKLEGHVHYFGPPPNPLWTKAKLQQPHSPEQRRHAHQQQSLSSHQSIPEVRVSLSNKNLKAIPSLSLTPSEYRPSNTMTGGYTTMADQVVVKTLSPLSSARTDTSDSRGDNIITAAASRHPLDATTTPQYHTSSFISHPPSSCDNLPSCDSHGSGSGSPSCELLRYQTAEDDHCRDSSDVTTGKSEMKLQEYLEKAEWVIRESVPYPSSSHSLPTAVAAAARSTAGLDVYSRLSVLPSEVPIRDRSHGSLLSSSSTSLSGTSSLTTGDVEGFDDVVEVVEEEEVYAPLAFRGSSNNNNNDNSNANRHIITTPSSISLHASTTSTGDHDGVYPSTPMTDVLTPLLGSLPSSSPLTAPQHANAPMGSLPSDELEVRERQELDQLRYLQMIRRRVKESPSNGSSFINDNSDNCSTGTSTRDTAEERLGFTAAELDGNLVASALFHAAEPTTTISHEKSIAIPSEKSVPPAQPLPLPLPVFGNHFSGSSCSSSMDYDEYDVKYHDGRIQVVKKSPLKIPKENTTTKTAANSVSVAISSVPVAGGARMRSPPPPEITHWGEGSSGSTPRKVSTVTQKGDIGSRNSGSSSGIYSLHPSDEAEGEAVAAAVREEGGIGFEGSRRRLNYDSLKRDEKEDQASSGAIPRALASSSSCVLSDAGYCTTTTAIAATATSTAVVSSLTRRSSLSNMNEASLRAAERVRKHRRALSLQKEKEIKEKLREEEYRNKTREEKIQFAITKQEGSLYGSMYDADGRRLSLPPPATVSSPSPSASSSSAENLPPPPAALSSMSSLSSDQADSSLCHYDISPSSFAGSGNTPMSMVSSTRSCSWRCEEEQRGAADRQATTTTTTTISPRSIGTSLNSYQTPSRTPSSTAAAATTPPSPPLEDIPPYIHPRHRLSGLSLTPPENNTKESCYGILASSFPETRTTPTSTLRASNKSFVLLSPIVTGTEFTSDIPVTGSETLPMSPRHHQQQHHHQQQLVLDEVTTLQALITSTLIDGRHHRDSSSARSPLSSRNNNNNNSNNPAILSDIWNTNRKVVTEGRFSNSINNSNSISLARPNKLESTVSTESQGLTLKVKRAWNLPDLLGGTNAYVVLDWGGLGRGRTPVVYDCTEPTFDFIIRFRPSFDPSSPTASGFSPSPSPGKESSIERDGYDNSNQSVNNLYAIPLLIQLFSRNISVSDEFLGQAVVTFSDLNSAKDGFLRLNMNSESFFSDIFLEVSVL